MKVTHHRVAISVIAGSMLAAAAAADAPAEGVPCAGCTDLLAIPALEELPEHAFGWTFGDPQPFCRLSSDSRLRREDRTATYRGRSYIKVFVASGACSGHGGWILEQDGPRWPAPLSAGTPPDNK